MWLFRRLNQLKHRLFILLIRYNITCEGCTLVLYHTLCVFFFVLFCFLRCVSLKERRNAQMFGVRLILTWWKCAHTHTHNGSPLSYCIYSTCRAHEYGLFWAVLHGEPSSLPRPHGFISAAGEDAQENILLSAGDCWLLIIITAVISQWVWWQLHQRSLGIIRIMSVDHKQLPCLLV